MKKIILLLLFVASQSLALFASESANCNSRGFQLGLISSEGMSSTSSLDNPANIAPETLDKAPKMNWFQKQVTKIATKKMAKKLKKHFEMEAAAPEGEGNRRGYASLGMSLVGWVLGWLLLFYFDSAVLAVLTILAFVTALVLGINGVKNPKNRGAKISAILGLVFSGLFLGLFAIALAYSR